MQMSKASANNRCLQQDCLGPSQEDNAVYVNIISQGAQNLTGIAGMQFKRPQACAATCRRPVDAAECSKSAGGRPEGSPDQRNHLADQQVGQASRSMQRSL